MPLCSAGSPATGTVMRDGPFAFMNAMGLTLPRLVSRLREMPKEPADLACVHAPNYRTTSHRSVIWHRNTLRGALDESSGQRNDTTIVVKLSNAIMRVAI
jgi:hypothetical protein